MQRNENYFANGKSKCPDSVRFAGKSLYIKAIISSIEVRDNQFGHLYKGILRETLVSVHP